MFDITYILLLNFFYSLVKAKGIYAMVTMGMHVCATLAFNTRTKNCIVG